MINEIEATVDAEAIACSFLWKIKNLSIWKRLGMKGRIFSPVFIADSLGKTKWILELYNYNHTPEFICFGIRRPKDCKGPGEISLECQLAFLDKNGLVLKVRPMKHKFFKGYGWEDPVFVEFERVFDKEMEGFLPADTLNVECTLWNTGNKPERSDHLFATTVIEVKQRCFLWRIDKPLDIKDEIAIKFDDYLITFFIKVSRDWKMNLGVFSFDESVRHMIFTVSIVKPEERQENCAKFAHCSGSFGYLEKGSFICLLDHKICMANKVKYFPNDVLSLHFEFSFLTFEHSVSRKYYDALENEVVGCKKSQNIDPIDDLSSKYKDDASKDVEILIGREKVRAHKAILTARSPVLDRMFNNGWEESESKSLSINNFDYNTVELMIKYIYSGKLEEDDLSLEIVCKLYAISVIYDILSLKSICSALLEDNLHQTNVCKILLLANERNDRDLKSVVQDYILRQRPQFFQSEEWRNFIKNHLKIAADVMHEKITKVNL